MNPIPASPIKDAAPTPTIRGPELGPVLKRDRLLRRVLVARRRLAPIPANGITRLR